MRYLPDVPKTGINPRNVELAAEWLQWLRDHGRTPLTVYQYGAKLEELLRHLGPMSLADVTIADLEGWVARPRVGRGRSQLGADATRAKDTLICRGLYKWAVAHGHLRANPTVDMEVPKVRNEKPRALTVDLWRRFWLSPCLSETERVAYGLMFYCGLRREEVCRIKVDNVDIDAGMIRNFKRKGDRGRSSGTTPFVSCARLFAAKHPELLPDANAFLDPLKGLTTASSDWLLPWGHEAALKPQSWRGGSRPVPDGMTSPDQINNRLRFALKRAGLPERAFSPHALRHSFVTYLLRADVPLEVVSKLSNHSNLDITLRYTTLAEDPLRELLGEARLKGSRWGS